MSHLFSLVKREKQNRFNQDRLEIFIDAILMARRNTNRDKKKIITGKFQFAIKTPFSCDNFNFVISTYRYGAFLTIQYFY